MLQCHFLKSNHLQFFIHVKQSAVKLPLHLLDTIWSLPLFSSCFIHVHKCQSPPPPPHTTEIIKNRFQMLERMWPMCLGKTSLRVGFVWQHGQSKARSQYPVVACIQVASLILMKRFKSIEIRNNSTLWTIAQQPYPTSPERKKKKNRAPQSYREKINGLRQWAQNEEYLHIFGSKAERKRTYL